MCSFVPSLPDTVTSDQLKNYLGIFSRLSTCGASTLCLEQMTAALPEL